MCDSFKRFLNDNGLPSMKWFPLLKLLKVQSEFDLKQLSTEKYHELVEAAEATDEEKSILQNIIGSSLKTKKQSPAPDIQFEDLLRSLGLYESYPQKLKSKEAKIVRKEFETLSVDDIPKLPFVVLQKLIMFDSQCRTSLIKVPRFQDGDGTVHPMDCLLALIHCSDNFLRQIIFFKLAMCQLAVPFLLPDPKNETVTLLLWAMKSIIKEWHYNNVLKEERIVDCKAPIVSFMRYGEIPNISKSELINSIMFDENVNTFFHWNLLEGNPQRKAVDGFIDASWYLPSDNPEKNTFQHVVTIANLHGDCSQHRTQWNFLAKCSFMNVVLVNSINALSDESVEMFRKLSQVPGGLVLLSREKNFSVKDSTVLKGIGYDEIALYDSEGRKTSIKNVKGDFISIFQGKSNSRHFKCMNECIGFAKESGILIDEENNSCMQGHSLAKQLNIFESQKRDKNELLPLQGKKLWCQWAQEDKEYFRVPKNSKSDRDVYRKEKEREKSKIRVEQWKKVLSKSLFIMEFCSHLSSLENDTEAELYYLSWMKLFLDDHSRDSFKVLYPKYLEHKKNLPKSIEDLKLVVDDMIAASIGIEHFMRELGQMYESSILNIRPDTPRSIRSYVESLPTIAANLLISGYPFEVMDGDASHVPKQWVTAVLEKVKESLRNPSVLVVSILGVQSTGKSTLLNTVFGLQFSVSAGRCTRGVFMQLVPLEEDLCRTLRYSHILVVDTEGLRAPELSSELSTFHDNEIATFVIGIANVTIINLYGEVFSEMEDILQTVVHAFLRMKEVRKESRVLFVHQNVTAVSARKREDPGRMKFRESLDKMTCLAAKQESCEKDYASFNDVLKFDDENDVFHLPSLWIGNPPMAPVNPGYSEKAMKLKSCILKNASHQPLSFFLEHLKEVWKAVLYEDFVFSFKNTLEVVAYTSLENVFSQWKWKLQREMLEWEHTTKNTIESCDPESFPDIKNTQLSKADEIIEQWELSIMNEKKQFFEGDYKQVLVQWEDRTENRLNSLKQEKVQEAKILCNSLIENRQGRADVERRQVQYQGLLMEFVKKLLKDLETQLSPDELRSRFNKEWLEWMEKIPSFGAVRGETNVKKELERILTNKFSNEKEFSERGGLSPVTETKIDSKS